MQATTPTLKWLGDLVVKDNNIMEIKRGPKPKYTFTEQELIIDCDKLVSFKNLLWRHNNKNGTSYKYGFKFRPNSSKVTATRLV